MKTVLPVFLLALFFSATCMAASNHHGDAIAGVWQTEKGGYVQIYHKDDGWYGRAVGDKNGEPRYDKHNPDSSRRNRRLLGKIVLRHLKYKEEHHYDDGEIYDPSSGKTYSAEAELKSFNKLHVRGYVGISLFGKTQNWHRIDPKTENVHQNLLHKPIPPGPKDARKQSQAKQQDN